MVALDGLSQLISHRAVFKYADGILVSGYVQKVLPSGSEPFLVELNRATVYQHGQAVAVYREFVVVLSMVSDFSLQEGPAAASK